MTADDRLTDVPLESPRWDRGGAHATPMEYRGRPCLLLETSESAAIPTLAGIELEDGVVELDLATGPGRGFHGVVWRLLDGESYESFFVRPHQRGNPDAVQYTPVWNDISCWQLYHGPGFWAPIEFPLDDWFTIRVVFQGSRAEVFVGEGPAPALVVRELKRPPAPGRVGILVGGPAIHVARFAYGTEASLGPAPPSPPPPPAGVITDWQVSDPFSEALLGNAPVLPDALVAERSWRPLAAEPSGLVDLARAHGVRDGRDTVLACATLHAGRAGVRRLELGFSDRAVVYLNGRALYRGDDTYRSRDYRFLGSIGWYDTLYVPLEEGDNDLVVAVSEDFGGWGVQARLAPD
jgi:hypothetical protein